MRYTLENARKKFNIPANIINEIMSTDDNILIYEVCDWIDTPEHDSMVSITFQLWGGYVYNPNDIDFSIEVFWTANIYEYDIIGEGDSSEGAYDDAITQLYESYSTDTTAYDAWICSR